MEGLNESHPSNTSTEMEKGGSVGNEGEWVLPELRLNGEDVSERRKPGKRGEYKRRKIVIR